MPDTPSSDFAERVAALPALARGSHPPDSDAMCVMAKKLAARTVPPLREPRQEGFLDRDAPVPKGLQALCLLLAAPAGWLFAEHVDPDGALMRWTLGWLVGEFR